MYILKPYNSSASKFSKKENVKNRFFNDFTELKQNKNEFSNFPAFCSTLFTIQIDYRRKNDIS